MLLLVEEGVAPRVGVGRLEALGSQMVFLTVPSPVMFSPTFTVAPAPKLAT